MNYREHVRTLAYANIAGLEPISDDPIESLKALDWTVPISDEPIDQNELLRLNLNLEPTYCQGRSARAAAFVEKWFPKAKLQYAEVLEDCLRNMMLDIIAQGPIEESMLTELLSYEDPHSIILVNGVQFDPISVQLGFDVVHPRVDVREVWKAFAADWLITNAKLCDAWIDQQQFLSCAEMLCPNRSSLLEAKASLYLGKGMITMAMACLAKIEDLRPHARQLFSLAALGDLSAKDRFLKTYPQELFAILEKETEGYKDEWFKRQGLGKY